MPELHRDSLARKLSIKPESDCYDWLERELAHRFDVACCATQEQFRRETRAITRAGQIKAPGERHEKDDRHRLDDRSRYVLGWSNAAKIAALESQARQLEKQLGDIGTLISQLQKDRSTLAAQLDALAKLEVFSDFAEIDWSTVATEIARLLDEKLKIESASDLLQQLSEKLKEAQAALLTSEAGIKEKTGDLGGVQARREAAQELARLADEIIATLTADIDASLAAAFEYEKLLKKLNADDLPKYEARFKELLNVNTINEIANFHAQLSREREDIKERIALINQSLTQIDYNPGRFIVLESQPTPDADIRDFQTELRACTEGSLTGSEDAQYSEAKFMQVKKIIDRFRGRDGQSELDKRWTAKVTDVRHWFIFGASERYREDGVEHEHYSDSGGKSGGQKEKLAYTILAASLAYQFGLEWGAVRSRSFRFVVIDEAFGRGSDESAQYGLKLFAQLNLQLLIVTPLQKIHIIEPHVASVGFVHNENGSDSKLRNLSIEEYREEKANKA